MTPLELKQMRKFLNMSQAEFGKLLSVTARSILNYERGRSPIPEHFVLIINREIERRNKDAEPDEQIIERSKDVIIDKPHTNVIIKLPYKTQLGLQNAMFKEEYISKLEYTEVEDEEKTGGRYFEIASEGDSMTFPTTAPLEDQMRSIYEGDVIVAREIARDLYINNKLHLHDWDEFVFFHYDMGIITKNVIDHNVAERKVLVRSYNENKDLYPDKWIDLNDCYIVANVVEIKRPRSNRRRINRLNGR